MKSRDIYEELTDLEELYYAKRAPIHALEAIAVCSKSGFAARKWSMRALEVPINNLRDICWADISDEERGRMLMRVLGFDYRQYLLADSVEALTVIECLVERRRSEIAKETGSRPSIEEVLDLVKAEFQEWAA